MTPQEFIKAEMHERGIPSYCQLSDHLGYKNRHLAKGITDIMKKSGLLTRQLAERMTNRGWVVPPEFIKQKEPPKPRAPKLRKSEIVHKEYPSYEPEFKYPCGRIISEGSKCFVKQTASDCVYIKDRIIQGVKAGDPCEIRPKHAERRHNSRSSITIYQSVKE